MSRVLLAMSGGVDSSVAALLLRNDGHDVVGAFMRRGEGAEGERGCGNARDEADARAVADRLGVPLHVLAFDAHFQPLIDYFIDEYLAARTPNPCVVCNATLKFGRLFDLADELDAEFVATGHYARIVRAPGEAAPALRRATHPGKDQSYALFGIARDRLARLLFPNGELSKEAIRKLALDAGFPVFDKPDSQEICFVPDQDHARFIHERRPDVDTSGEIVTTDGDVVARHDGLERFTIGQRKGLGVAMGEPYFVVRLEADTRRVVIGRKEDLAVRALTATGANWLIDVPCDTFMANVKIRYRSSPAPATVTPSADGCSFEVLFGETVYGVAPGQAAVCYDGDRVLGGGWIESAHATRDG